ncbi:unnamed protein product, partial [Iphiclides podalirius]
MKINYKKVTHVLFDLDGLLIDSEKLYTEAFTKVCAKYGKTFTWELKKSILGFQGHECAEKIIESVNLPTTVESFLEECKMEYEVLFQNVSLMPGAKNTDPEVTKGKPDPAIFLVCASKFADKPKPENCLVFEDAVNGVKAACAANMQVVIVPDPRIGPDQLADATLILQSLEEFQPEG